MRRDPFEIAILVATFLWLGPRLVPAHWTSLWMDREFQGWMIAVARRLGESKLYADGMHIPMPPLPFVLEYLLWGENGRWIDESLLNFAFQSLLVLVMVRTLSLFLRNRVPFVAALVATPIVFSLQKLAIHDSMGQFFAAATALAVLETLHAAPGSRRRLLCALAAGLLNALCALSKQSTAAGVLAGSAVAFLAAGRSWRAAIAHVGITVAGTALFAALLIPFLDYSSFWSDVFVHGAEPKGGVPEALRNLRRYFFQFLPTLVLYALPALLLLRLSRGVASEERWGALRRLSALAAAACLAFLCGRNGIEETLLHLGICCALAAPLWALVDPENRTARSSAVLTLVLVPAAITHNLSTRTLRWTYDNNPIIFVAIALVASAGSSAIGHLLPRAAARAVVGSLALWMIVASWRGLAPNLRAAQACTERWPEVAHLEGARLRPEAAKMRELVGIVRDLAAPGEEVFLIPEDPNVHAWLERPRPKLTSAIVFADQYWDHTVEEDLRRLRAKPPKVILIGPLRFGPYFHRLFNRETYGALRLLERIEEELIPNGYIRLRTHTIEYRSGEDALAIFVRAPSSQTVPSR